MNHKVRFVGYSRQYQQLKKEFNAVFKEIMSGGNFILRKHLEELENRIAKYVGTKYAIGVNTGTDALYLSAHALGFGPGDEVITVAHTFVATVGAIVQCGATPVLIDIGEDYNMNVEQIESAITSKTKGIIPVHLNGHSCNMDKIMELAKKYNLKVIEDAAQALGAEFKGKKCASFGDVGIFSFYPAKMLGAPGDGGMVCTNADNLARKIKAFRDNGRVDSVEVIECFGWCSRLDNLHAAILNMKFKYFEKWVERRRKIAKMYDDGLSGIDGLITHPHSNGDYFDVYQNYVVRTKRQDEMINHLRNSGIEVLVSWPVPLHQQKALGLSRFNLPMTEQVSAEVISLPIYPELTDGEVQIVIEAVRRFFQR
ncbi:MAG TPA: DegT/DnrJ/EryC1/StrS family aminotransferase [Elusimicrobia bacterium]|jgi:dTDP-4-amino-4,6-dideoxygalactose transaminase|nr:DegT/DnrJ/EryC1/StrS family aminotransferase [Elusimicrobiota bacterium]